MEMEGSKNYYIIVKGPGYTYSDLFTRIEGSMRFGVEYDVPSTFETTLYFFVDIFIFALLAWYFDHVDSSNRGKTYKPFFFLDKNYWCGKSKKKSEQEKRDENIGIVNLTKVLNSQEQHLLQNNTGKILNINSSGVSFNNSCKNKNLIISKLRFRKPTNEGR